MKVRFLIAASLLAVTISPVRAATITVSNTDDNGPGSLRAALASAANGDTIEFSITGTITLTSGELTVTNSLTILGPGASALAINGNGVSRVFNITSLLSVTISSLTITNGRAYGGGAIVHAYGLLTISNCVLSGNYAAFEGGAIANINTVVQIYNSTLSANSANTDGGAIYNLADNGTAGIVIANSTLSGNSARGGGGGIYNEASVFLDRATLQIANSTLSGNKASSGGGIFSWGIDQGIETVEIANSILKAGTSGGTIYSASDIPGRATVTSRGYNLSSDAAGGFLTNTNDRINTDPLLDPAGPRDNGGPTPTIALQSGSPAIDAGRRDRIAALASGTDQRGFPRPYDDPNVANATGGDGSDIGAYEASELRITALDILDDNLCFSFTSVLGRNYELQSRTDLVSGTWSSLPGSTPGNGGIAQTTVTNALSQTQQFYRLHQLP